jgi:Tfp pilus assembly protein PilN
VANFITQLRRSGYFDQVEIKESQQDEKVTAVQMFNFTLNVQFALPQAVPATQTQPTGGKPAPSVLPTAAVTPTSRKG